MSLHKQKIIQSNEANNEKLTYWRSIENRRRTQEYLDYIADEFAPDISDITHVDRRSMLKFMGASIALAGLGISCRRPEEKILPYSKPPADLIPGIPNYFATSYNTPFGAHGLLVESHENRPTKIEGNPIHPYNQGKASILDQSSVLDLYDPDRSKFCWLKKADTEEPVNFVEFNEFAKAHFDKLATSQGEGLAFLVDNDQSSTCLRLKSLIKKRFPKAQFFVHEVLRQVNSENACHLAFGKNTKVSYNFSKAKVIASLFADPFSFGPQHLDHLRGFAKNRTINNAKDAKAINRLYAIESDFSLFGINADNRLRLPIGLAKKLVEALAYELHATYNIEIDKSITGFKSLSNLVSMPVNMKGLDRKFVYTLAKDLALNKGSSLIIGGDHLPKEVLAMIHALNTALMGFKNTFDVLEINDTQIQEHLAEPDLLALDSQIQKNLINTLVMLEVNPVHTASNKINFLESLKKVPLSIHLGLYRDETGSNSTWHLSATHFLEHFSDARAFDGTISIVQPLIKPLYDSKSKLELMAFIASHNIIKPLDLVKETFALNNFSNFNKAVHDGFIANSAYLAKEKISLNCEEIYKLFASIKTYYPELNKPELILNFDRKILDGRFANSSWLQELPDPVTKINWDNVLLMSPVMAKELKIKSGVRKNAYVAEIVKISVGKNSLELPVFVLPGLSDYSLITNLGYGRTKAGEIAKGVGVDAFGLYSGSENMTFSEVSLSRTSKEVKISCTQEQYAMNGDTVQEVDVLTLQSRDPARDRNIDEYMKDPNYASKEGIPENLLTLENNKKVPLQITKPPFDYSKNNQWGMAIDLTKCTGCNACIIACKSENNIPIVGKDQVMRGRLMDWIRVDRYFTGDVKSPKVISQPMPCQHCENAPCEPVCPVAATSHDTEGLNVMTYNRCVGTRYCANNCPFKVRRFNYFDYTKSGDLYVDDISKDRQKTLSLQRNPDVTVRYRGVMEKCTYCTQRIQEAKMKARRENRDPNNLTDADVTSACAQTCPSEAITFGNINDKNSKVYAMKNVDRNYTLLDILNARPRTSYLAKIRNPHPDLAG